MRKGLARGQYLGNARLAPHKRVRACTRACRPPLPLQAATTIISIIVNLLHVAHKKRHRNENFVNAYARFAQSNCSNHQIADAGVLFENMLLQKTKLSSKQQNA